MRRRGNGGVHGPALHVLLARLLRFVDLHAATEAGRCRRHLLGQGQREAQVVAGGVAAGDVGLAQRRRCSLHLQRVLSLLPGVVAEAGGVDGSTGGLRNVGSRLPVCLLRREGHVVPDDLDPGFFGVLDT